MLKIRQIISIFKICLILFVVGVGVYAVNPNLKSMTGALIQSSVAFVSPSLKGGDWQPPTVPGKIGWTSELLPQGNLETGADLDQYTTCGEYWKLDSVSNVWGASTDFPTGINHYIRNVYKANDVNASSFSLVSTTTPTTQYESQASNLLANPGIYEVEIAAVDQKNNQSAFTPRCRLTVDGTAPSSTASLVGSVGNASTATIHVSASDDLSKVDLISLYYRRRPYGGSFGSWTLYQTHDVTDALSVSEDFSFDSSTTGGDGEYEFYSLATDKAINVESALGVAEVSVQIDTTVNTPTFVAPANGSVHQPTALVLDWDDVADPHGLVTYDVQRSNSASFATIDFTATGLTVSQIDQSGLANGTYYWRVRACDGLGNCSQYSSAWSLLVDGSAPISSVTISNSPAKDINNRIVNGDFESGLTGWTTVGDVSVITGSEHGVNPYDGKMARIGRDVDAGAKSVDTNILSQPINNSGNGVRSVGFWYNFQTYESSAGFDEPGFMVFVNDKMVHQVWANDVPNPVLGELHGTGWRFLSVDVSQYNNPTLSIAFYSGNTGDLSHQSFVYLDNVTTNEAAVNAASVFTLSATDNASGVASVNYRYTVNGVPTVGSGPSGLTFSLTSQPDNGAIEYWAVDALGNTESHNNFHVMYDNTPPAAVTDLATSDDQNGDFTLNWTAPTDANPYGVDSAAEYDIRYSTSAIDPALSDAQWSALPQPVIRNTDGLPGGGLRAPLLSGKTETYAVHVNDGVAQYWFAVRSKDHAKNTSTISNIATSGVPTVTTTSSLPGDVVINEVMWMGSSTASNDEWLELRNMTDKNIDLSGWVIENAGDSVTPNLILPAGSVLSANGFYVIAHDSLPNSAMKNAPNLVTTALDLNDVGEQLTLQNAGATTIDMTPAGAWVAGENTANKRSMERNNIPGDGSDATNWHTCDSDSCGDAQALYWKVVGTDFGTPGAANLSFNLAQIKPVIKLEQADAQNLRFTVNDVQIFTTLSYVVEYDHIVDGQNVHEGITGKMDFPLLTRQVVSPLIYLGTCSTGPQSCVPHVGVSNAKVTVVLKGNQVSDKTLVSELK
jgi:hypothetical protein